MCATLRQTIAFSRSSSLYGPKSVCNNFSTHSGTIMYIRACASARVRVCVCKRINLTHAAGCQVVWYVQRRTRITVDSIKKTCQNTILFSREIRFLFSFSYEWPREITFGSLHISTTHCTPCISVASSQGLPRVRFSARVPNKIRAPLRVTFIFFSSYKITL